MFLICPFCKELLLQAFKNINYGYAVCVDCFKQFVQEFGRNQFERISILISKGNIKLADIRKTNQELKVYLSRKMMSLKQIIQNNVIEEFYEKLNCLSKSIGSDISTDPSLTFDINENGQKTQKATKITQQKQIGQNSTASKINNLKSKIVQSGSNLLQKVKHSQRIQKQVQNINFYKDKMMETGDSMMGKLQKFRNEFKGIRSQLPSLKTTLQNVEIKQIFKSRFFKW